MRKLFYAFAAVAGLCLILFAFRDGQKKEQIKVSSSSPSPTIGDYKDGLGPIGTNPTFLLPYDVRAYSYKGDYFAPAASTDSLIGYNLTTRQFTHYALPAAATYSYSTGVSRSLNTNFTISSTLRSSVKYTVRIAYNVTALLGSTGSASLQYSTDGAITWKVLQTVSNSINLGIVLTGYNDFPLSGDIPPNAVVKIASSATNATITLRPENQETTY